MTDQLLTNAQVADYLRKQAVDKRKIAEFHLNLSQTEIVVCAAMERIADAIDKIPEDTNGQA